MMPPAGAAPQPQAAPQGGPDPMAAYQAAMADWQKRKDAFDAYQNDVAQKQQEFQAACALLKNDAMRTFRLDIEADSTIAPDEQAEKQGRVEFLEAFGSLVQNSAPLVQSMPQQGGKLVAEILRFAAHGFRAGRPLLETIDKFADSLEDLPPAQPKTDPALAKVEADTQIAQKRLDSETQIETIKANALAQREQMRGQAEVAKAAAEANRINRETALKEKAQKDELQVKLAKVAADEAVGKHANELAHQREMDKFLHQHALETAKADASLDLERRKGAAGQRIEREKAGLTGPKRVRRKLVGAEKGADGKIASVEFVDEPIDDDDQPGAQPGQ